MAKNILLVAEGVTDIIVFEAIANLSDNEINFVVMAPQRDATSGTYKAHGFRQVMNWCNTNRNKIQTFIDFSKASALFVHMDTDIAKQINKTCIALGHRQRECCVEALNKSFSSNNEPKRCYYILPTQNIETWLLASYEHSGNCLSKTKNYESITNPEQRLIDLNLPQPSQNKQKKLDKAPKKYELYAQQLIKKLSLARSRCAELERLCTLIFNIDKIK